MGNKLFDSSIINFEWRKQKVLVHVLWLIWIIVGLHPQTAFVFVNLIMLSCPFMIFEFLQLHVILTCLEENFFLFLFHLLFDKQTWFPQGKH